MFRWSVWQTSPSSHLGSPPVAASPGWTWYVWYFGRCFGTSEMSNWGFQDYHVATASRVEAATIVWDPERVKFQKAGTQKHWMPKSNHQHFLIFWFTGSGKTQNHFVEKLCDQISHISKMYLKTSSWSILNFTILVKSCMPARHIQNDPHYGIWEAAGNQHNTSGIAELRFSNYRLCQ